jgi:hypothetical protein
MHWATCRRLRMSSLFRSIFVFLSLFVGVTVLQPRQTLAQDPIGSDLSEDVLSFTFARYGDAGEVLITVRPFPKSNGASGTAVVTSAAKEICSRLYREIQSLTSVSYTVAPQDLLASAGDYIAWELTGTMTISDCDKFTHHGLHRVTTSCFGATQPTPFPCPDSAPK